MNAAQEEIERLKESLRLLQAQYCRTIDPLLEDDGETPKYKAENERLRGELAEATAIWKGNMQLFSDKAERAEASAVAAYDLLRECFDWGMPEDLKERIDVVIGKKK